jgi:hypothetical protein
MKNIIDNITSKMNNLKYLSIEVNHHYEGIITVAFNDNLSSLSSNLTQLKLEFSINELILNIITKLMHLQKLTFITAACLHDSYSQLACLLHLNTLTILNYCNNRRNNINYISNINEYQQLLLIPNLTQLSLPYASIEEIQLFIDTLMILLTPVHIHLNH